MSNFLAPITHEGLFLVEMYTTKLLAEWHGPYKSALDATSEALLLGTRTTNYIDYIIHHA